MEAQGVVEQTFNSAVIASAYTGWVIIPESFTDLYEAVKPLREEMERRAGLEEADVLSGQYQDGIREEMRKCFPNLQRFEAAAQVYFDKGGRDLSREEAWPHLRDLADHLISDHTIDLDN